MKINSLPHNSINFGLKNSLLTSKKLFLLLFIFCLQFAPAKAQWVTIPDANFVNWLQLHYPTCMNGNLMDTTCSGIVNETIVDVTFKYISNISGIEYFDNLDSLNCTNNNLTSITHLPHNLRSFCCASNQITNIAFLPDSLQYLNCFNNSTLPNLPSLPIGLKTLICASTGLNSLPILPSTLLVLQSNNCQISNYPALPSGLKEFYYGFYGSYFPITIPPLPNGLLKLYIHGNVFASGVLPTLPNTLTSLQLVNCPISNLPTVLPISLLNLNINYCPLTSLPPLPSTLTFLTSVYGNLTSLPNLPNDIIFINVYNNQITALPPLPTSLNSLHCQNNLITTLPTLPNNLSNFDCSHNSINSIPILPYNLSKLICSFNNILCFPVLPNSLVFPPYFNVSNNPFTCLPNYVPAMDAATLAVPLCQNNDTINNPNNCIAAKGIVGNTYFDTNANCVKDAADTAVKYISLKLYDNSNSFVGYTYSALNGVYQFPIAPGTYKVAIDTTNAPYRVNCIYPGIDSLVTVTAVNPLVENVNFELDCKGGYDVGTIAAATSCIIFPGQQHFLRLFSGDVSQFFGMNCAAGVSGQVVFNLNGHYTYVSPLPGALTPTVNGTTYTYAIPDFGNIDNMNAFGLLLLTDTLAQGGDLICGNVLVTPNVGDNNVSNNNVNFCYAVTNSHDPNNKEVYPTDVLPGYADWLTYTIHFQNTGTAAAINISIVDTLNSNLDLSTFEYVTSSHTSTVQLIGNVAKFRFTNINLPDSTSDLFGSQGFVQYRIKPNANLPLGTQIKNTAHIYFDFNPAVVTNTTINNFTTVVTTIHPKISDNETFSIYPNPSTGIFTFKDSKNIKTIEVYNLMGELILSQGNAKQINLQGFPQGIYVAKINGQFVSKLVKE